MTETMAFPVEKVLGMGAPKLARAAHTGHNLKGEKIVKYCTNCGVEVREGAKFCAKCGHPLQVDNPAPEQEGRPSVEELSRP